MKGFLMMANIEDIEDVEVDLDWPSKSFQTSLHHLLEVADKGGSPIYVLEGLLSVTLGYLDYSSIIDDKDIDSEIVLTFMKLKEFFNQTILKSQSETFEKSMAIGQFIEALIYHGLPRIAAIEATAKWLDIGKSTVRTHNENFRKSYGYREDRGLKLIFYISLMYEKINNSNNFYTVHPKAKKAFEETKKFYEERIEIRNNMFKALNKVTQKKSA